jgi:hypothetical protein
MLPFPRMNYRRKKISMKEQLEEAIEEIGGEPLQGSESERETPKEGSVRSNLVLPSFASRTLTPTVGTHETQALTWQFLLLPKQFSASLLLPTLRSELHFFDSGNPIAGLPSSGKGHVSTPLVKS